MTRIEIARDEVRRTFGYRSFVEAFGVQPVDIQRDVIAKTWIVTFDPDLTEQQQADVVAWLTSVNANDRTLRDRAEAALASNRTYLNLTDPTAAQVRQQVERLTRQSQGLIRLVLDRLDGTD